MDLKFDNVVYIYTFEDAEIEIPEIDELNKNLKALTNDGPCYIIVFPGEGSISSHEARKYAATKKGKNIVAEAIVMNNLAIRLLANFYMKINRPEQKIKLFSNENAALEWINGIKGK
jgi:endo-1,4-beta-mannosidase